MKKILVFALLISLTSCFQDSSSQKNSTIENNSHVDKNGLSQTRAILKTKFGNIVIRFYPNKAPSTTKRITQLIREGFYNGLTFHRVIPNFVIQGGDPTGTGRGGSGQKLKAEFNDLKHIEGTVAMARAQDINSADSQFYIALSSLPHLDGKYTIFGQVVKGLDILHKIRKGDKIISFTLEELDK